MPKYRNEIVRQNELRNLVNMCDVRPMTMAYARGPQADIAAKAQELCATFQALAAGDLPKGESASEAIVALDDLAAAVLALTVQIILND